MLHCMTVQQLLKEHILIRVQCLEDNMSAQKVSLCSAFGTGLGFTLSCVVFRAGTAEGWGLLHRAQQHWQATAAGAAQRR